MTEVRHAHRFKSVSRNRSWSALCEFLTECLSMNKNSNVKREARRPVCKVGIWNLDGLARRRRDAFCTKATVWRKDGQNLRMPPLKSLHSSSECHVIFEKRADISRRQLTDFCLIAIVFHRIAFSPSEPLPSHSTASASFRVTGPWAKKWRVLADPLHPNNARAWLRAM